MASFSDGGLSMLIRCLPRNKCLTQLVLLFALLNTLACIIFMMLFFDGSSNGGQFESTMEGVGRGVAKSWRQHTARRQPPSRLNGERGFQQKGPHPVLNGYQSLLRNKSVKVQCNQCAIVSSSGQLLGSSAGPEIDSNDCIIRMNNAPTKGHESDVGSRTTIRIIGHVNLKKTFVDNLASREEILNNASTRTDSIFIHWSFLTNLDRDPPKQYTLAVNLAQTYPDVTFNMFTPQKMVYAEKLFEHETGMTRSQAKTWLSTGWYTFLFAMDSCKQINVYGMIWGDYCKEHPNEKVPYHYYGKAFKTECRYYHVSEVRLTSGHLFMTEKALFGRWAHAHNIHFHYPRWPARLVGPGQPRLLTPFVKRYQIAENRFFAKFPYWKLFFHFSGLFYPLVH